MRTHLISTLTIVIIMANVFSMTVLANGFDANYYANKYPDVVNALGNDPAILYNHYVNFGSKEGRFQSAQDEYESYTNALAGITDTTIAVPVLPVANAAMADQTYIDVDITSQKVTYYQNGQVALQTDCVTGNESLGRGTPRGTFSIKSKSSGRYLTGPTWHVWVDTWMPFEGGCGLHDASWRSSFGGDIYTTDGSHGCVNLPHDAAVTLYNSVVVGTTVVVH